MSENDIPAWPDLTRTERAVRAFDEGSATAESVGEAFALDTSDRNDPSTARLVRPGKASPANPADLSWVRKLLRSWRAAAPVR